MAEHSRRLFLKSASAGAVAVTAVAALPAAFKTAEDAKPTLGPLHDGSFVAWVQDVKAGEVAILVGSQTVVHQDENLAKRLAELAAKALRS